MSELELLRNLANSYEEICRLNKQGTRDMFTDHRKYEAAKRQLDSDFQKWQEWKRALQHSEPAETDQSAV